MNIQRKEIDIILNSKEYKAVLDFGAAIYFEGLTNKSIIVEIAKIAETQSISTIAALMASVIKTKTNKSIGMEEIKKVDLIGGFNYFVDKMNELFENSLPQNEEDNIDEEDKKKTIVD